MSVDNKDEEQQQLVAYYGLCFAAAAADGKVHGKELGAIFDQVPMEELDERHQALVEDLLFNRDIAPHIEVLKGAPTSVKYTVMVCLAEIIFADDKIKQSEQDYLDQVAEQLQVEPAHKSAIFDLIQTARSVTDRDVPPADAKSQIEQAMRQLMDYSIPLEALRYSNTTKALIERGLWQETA